MEHESSDVLHHQALNDIARRLRADLPDLVDETEARLHREQPEVIARIDSALLREAIAATHLGYAALLEGPGAGDGGPDGPRHVAFAAAAAGAGVGLDALLAGYRAGAQVGWAHVERYVAEGAVPSGAVMAAATTSLRYVDVLTADSFAGFARQAEAAGGARARERQALLAALLGGEGDETLAPLAAAARWPVPERLAVAVLLGPARGAEPDGDAVLLGLGDGANVAVVAEAGTAELLATGAALALGPPVPARQAALSLARARRLAALVVAGHLPAGRALRWEDHLAALVVHADAAAGEALGAARLAPLDGLPAARRTLLAETLAAWLDHPGRPTEIAAALHLHPQTVRYRLGRLRERFGDALDDPAARFELALALRAAG